MGPAVALEQVARVVEASPASREAIMDPAFASPAQVPDVAVRAAISSTRAPLSPLSANSTMAASIMARRVCSGARLRFSMAQV